MALWIYKGEYKKFAVILPSLGRAIAAEWGVPKEFPSDEQTEKDLLRLGFKRFESEPEKPKYHKKKKEEPKVEEKPEEKPEEKKEEHFELGGGDKND